MLDILISISTIIYMYLLSRKIKLGLYISLVSQLLWLVFIYTNEAWGLIPLNIALWYICVSGLKKWGTEH